jgi:type I restriction enzyme M protein
MLDANTKKNIDDCRDVLVGKVPDPKSQIEQITLALIYKFMDDMDKEAVEKFKGKAKFFTGEYAKYGWRNLFDPSLNGQEMLALYSDALEKLNTNPNIPELFRNIFKNAYLPYRDPSTLKLFLKYINEFEYSHSEKLGDAFEYLLSVMGSQGDAGQFRTPRHIIDFVTACVNPQKNETILDPACGTAGFLLSAFKHIRNQNSKETEIKTKDNLGNPIIQKILIPTFTPDDRKKLANNFVGYDISPDMVRLSLANMYLHGFATPLIHEYDSLSSEDRWQETFDVILANPPFMTPKGGIRPHKKFGVQANKAEVLFTDYIAEHLNSNGRAGIVVPNGIVATSQTAYKQLRKMLVQDSLIAVISLPAGVFQPYSGVKTSVLILDKRLAKKSKHILFLKIENDGFDLGAQRREIDKNDLPAALGFLETYKNCLNQDGLDLQDIQDLLMAYEQNPANPKKSETGFRGLNDIQDLLMAYEQNPANPKIDKIQIQTIATLVEKETVLGNKDVVLSAERYFEAKISQTNFDLVKLDEVCIIQSGGTPSKAEKSFWENGTIPWVGSTVCKNEVIYNADNLITELGLKKSNAKLFPKGTTLIALVGATIGKTAYLEFETTTNQNIAGLQVKDETILNKKYLFLTSQTLYDQFFALGDGGFRMASLSFIKELKIPLPPLEIQQQIVAEIEGYQKIIDGAKQIVNNYKPCIKINPDWEMSTLDEMCDFIDYRGKTPTKTKSGVRLITAKNVRKGFIDIEPQEFIALNDYDNVMTRGIPQKGDVLFTTEAPLGNVALLDLDERISLAQRIILLRPKHKSLLSHFLVQALLDPNTQNRIENYASGSTVLGIKQSSLREIEIPVPPIEQQELIVKAIEEEKQLVNSNKRLIEIFEQKIKTKIGEVWDVKRMEE